MKKLFFLLVIFSGSTMIAGDHLNLTSTLSTRRNTHTARQSEIAAPVRLVDVSSIKINLKDYSHSTRNKLGLAKWSLFSKDPRFAKAAGEWRIGGPEMSASGRGDAWIYKQGEKQLFSMKTNLELQTRLPRNLPVFQKMSVDASLQNYNGYHLTRFTQMTRGNIAKIQVCHTLQSLNGVTTATGTVSTRLGKSLVSGSFNYHADQAWLDQIGSLSVSRSLGKRSQGRATFGQNGKQINVALSGTTQVLKWRCHLSYQAN